MRQNASAAGALPRTPLRELTALPQNPYLDLGEGKGQEERWREGNG